MKDVKYSSFTKLELQKTLCNKILAGDSAMCVLCLPEDSLSFPY